MKFKINYNFAWSMNWFISSQSFLNHETMKDLISHVQNKFIEKNEFPKFSAGDTLTVYYEIREGEKVRTQF